MTSILKTDEIQSQNGGAVVKMQTLKHPSASGNNLELASDGNVSITNTLSAGTIGTGVTINAGTNVSGINQLVGISHRQTGAGAGTVVTVENNKSYIAIFFSYASETKMPKIFRLTVNGSGVVSQSTVADWSSTLQIQTGTNTINAYTSTTYEYHRMFVFEEGQTIDTA